MSRGKGRQNQIWYYRFMALFSRWGKPTTPKGVRFCPPSTEGAPYQLSGGSERVPRSLFDPPLKVPQLLSRLSKLKTQSEDSKKIDDLGFGTTTGLLKQARPSLKCRGINGLDGHHFLLEPSALCERHHTADKSESISLTSLGGGKRESFKVWGNARRTRGCPDKCSRSIL